MIDKAEREEVESETGKLFPKIHSTATHTEVQGYKDNIASIVSVYRNRFNDEDFIAGRDVLEVGCGGRAAGVQALMQFKPGSVRCIDLSEENVRLTGERAAELGYDNVKVSVDNALAPDFPDGSFDLAFSTGVIHHTVDPYRCFREMARVLRPGGYLLLGIYGYGGLWGRVVHPLGMLLGKIIPLSVMEKFVNATGILRSQENSLLDWFYTPIQMKFSEAEIYRWYEECGFEDTLRVRSPKWFYNMGVLTSLLFGDGYLYFIGRKKRP